MALPAMDVVESCLIIPPIGCDSGVKTGCILTMVGRVKSADGRRWRKGYAFRVKATRLGLRGGFHLLYIVGKAHRLSTVSRRVRPSLPAILRKKCTIVC